MDEKEKLELIGIVEKLDKEDRRKLLTVGEVLLALKNLVVDEFTPPTARA